MAQRLVKVLHLSDTHDLHWSIEDRFPFPEADILVHTGDFTNNGKDSELASFVAWLQKLAPRFKAIVLVAGNHDWYETRRRVEGGKLRAEEATAPGFYRQLMARSCKGGLPGNCHVLDHEETVVMGLRIWGSPWCPWNPCSRSSGVAPKDSSRRLFEARQKSGHVEDHRFGEIPEGMDILLTHGPAAGIMDCVAPRRSWGSSDELLQHIWRARPKVHCFGHLHEQRGLWQKRPTGFQGGIEYRVRPDVAPFVTLGPPPPSYPCELVSCNAMKNHGGLESTDTHHIAGPGRLLVLEAPTVEPDREESIIVAPEDEEAEVETAEDPMMVDDGEALGVAGGSVLLMNVRHKKLLATGNGRTTRMQVRGDPDDSNRWDLLPCPHEAGSAYVVHRRSGTFMDTHGRDLALWNNNGASVEAIIQGNVTKYAGNIRWRVMPCPHQEGAVYLVNVRHGTFLDTHNGSDLQVWNNKGRSVDTVVRENLSGYAGNIRWFVLPVA